MQADANHGGAVRHPTINGRVVRGRGLCLAPVAKPAQRVIGHDSRADVLAKLVEQRLSGTTGLHKDLDLGAVFVMVLQRRKGILRLTN